MTVQSCAIPTESALSRYAAEADFSDAYHTANPLPALSALQIWLETVKKTPRWIALAMHMRNAVVRRLGLKDLGSLTELDLFKTAQDYQVGDRLGIFTIVSIAAGELVLCDRDKHLDVYLSLCKVHAGRGVVVSTAVKTHNLLGRLYMLPVKPMHRRIVPAVLSRI